MQQPAASSGSLKMVNGLALLVGVGGILVSQISGICFPPSSLKFCLVELFKKKRSGEIDKRTDWYNMYNIHNIETPKILKNFCNTMTKTPIVSGSVVL